MLPMLHPTESVDTYLKYADAIGVTGIAATSPYAEVRDNLVADEAGDEHA